MLRGFLALTQGAKAYGTQGEWATNREVAISDLKENGAD